MADTKISALPASTTPLAGTETLPIVQGGATRQVSVANLTTGRALSAAQLTLTTGNLIVASGQGIDFSATPGTGTSELLDDYEEGTWTPIDDSGAGLVFSDAFGFYTKVGDTVTAWGRVTFPITLSGLTILVGGLPYVISGNSQPGGGFIRLTNSGRNDTVQASGASTFILFFDNNLNAASNFQYSGDRVDFVVIYKV